MRGYVIRVMQLGKAYSLPRSVEIVTPKESMTDLILKLGHLPERKGYWDIFYVEGDPLLKQDEKLDDSGKVTVMGLDSHAILNGIPVQVKYVLMHGSLVFTDEGYTLYQRFHPSADIPF